MATIDLRHLVSKPCDVVTFIGDVDGQEYKLPIKKTVGALLIMQDYMSEFNKKRTSEKYTSSDLIELGYITVGSWIQSFYPEIDLEWTKDNINSDVFEKLSEYANNLFFPKMTETEKPGKNPKTPKARGRKKAHKS